MPISSLMRFILALTCVYAAIAHPAHTPMVPKPPWALDMDATIPIAVPPSIRSVVGPNLEYEEGQAIKGVVVDLNEDGIKDYLVQSSPALCGNGGCAYVLFDGATNRQLGQFFGNPLYVRVKRVHGYPNIATYSHSSVESGSYTTYSFDSTAYHVTSTREVQGAALDSLFATLRRVPKWRPQASSDSGLLVVPLVSQDPLFVAPLPGDLSVRVEREVDARGTSFGWWLRVVGPTTPAGQSVLQPPLPPHGPHPADILAWSAREQYFPDERQFWVDRPPLEIVSRLVNYSTAADSASAWFTSGTLEISWRRTRRP